MDIFRISERLMRMDGESWAPNEVPCAPRTSKHGVVQPMPPCAIPDIFKGTQ